MQSVGLRRRLEICRSLRVRVLAEQLPGSLTRMKLISYATGGLMGSVTGGSVVGSLEKGEGFQFNLIGAVLGGVFGIGLNYILLNR